LTSVKGKNLAREGVLGGRNRATIPREANLDKVKNEGKLYPLPTEGKSDRQTWEREAF